MIAAAEDFDVGSTGQSRADVHQHIARRQTRDVHPLNAQLLLAIKHGSRHLFCHSAVTSEAVLLSSTIHRWDAMRAQSPHESCLRGSDGKSAPPPVMLR